MFPTRSTDAGYRRALLAKYVCIDGKQGKVDSVVPSLLQMFSSEQAHGELCNFAPTVTQSRKAKIQSGYRRALLAKSV